MIWKRLYNEKSSEKSRKHEKKRSLIDVFVFLREICAGMGKHVSGSKPSECTDADSEDGSAGAAGGFARLIGGKERASF